MRPRGRPTARFCCFVGALPGGSAWGPTRQPRPAASSLASCIAGVAVLLQGGAAGWDRRSRCRPRRRGAALAAAWAAFAVALAATAAGRLSWSLLLGGAAWAKVVASFLKYIPQAAHNARRRSTDGWSVGSVLGDTTGGVFSLAQQLTRCVQAGSWAPLVGNVAKLGLAAVSLFFDALFLTQHYWWYAGLSPVGGEAYGRLASDDEEGREMLETEGSPPGERL